MLQALAHEGVETNRLVLFRQLPGFYHDLICLIRHTTCRTITHDRSNEEFLGMSTQCFSVIIAGGKGTRFWPLSRAKRPKQLLKIISQKSLIVETAERVYPISGRGQTLVV